MFDLEAQIKHWREELARSGINAREVVDELEGHLRERIDRLSASSYPKLEAFQMAVQQLGDGKSLKPEFTKLKRGRLQIFRDNSLGLNVLAVWFVVMGLNTLIGPLYRLCVSFLEFVRVEARWHPGIEWNATLTGASLILIGIGLLRGWKFFRLLALWSASTLLFSDAYFYYYFARHWSSLMSVPSDAVVHYRFLGLPMPIAFVLRKAIDIVILLLGIYTLLRPQVEKLFRRAAAE